MSIREFLSVIIKIIGIIAGAYVGIWSLLLIPMMEIITGCMSHSIWLGTIVIDLIKCILSIPICIILIGCWFVLAEEIEKDIL